MSLEDFKKIFWMEWAHRQVGRAIGLLFVLPAAYFVARGYVNRRMAVRLTGIGALLGTQVRVPPPRSVGRPGETPLTCSRAQVFACCCCSQGLIGWLMVKSGLDSRIVEERAVPRVSHYRLAAHLGTAFLIYIATLWNGLTLMTAPRSAEVGGARSGGIGATPRSNRIHPYTSPGMGHRRQYLQALATNPSLRRFRALAAAGWGMVFLTAMSGTLPERAPKPCPFEPIINTAAAAAFPSDGRCRRPGGRLGRWPGVQRVPADGRQGRAQRSAGHEAHVDQLFGEPRRGAV